VEEGDLVPLAAQEHEEGIGRQRPQEGVRDHVRERLEAAHEGEVPSELPEMPLRFLL
jgi:hypothetical protein